MSFPAALPTGQMMLQWTHGLALSYITLQTAADPLLDVRFNYPAAEALHYFHRRFPISGYQQGTAPLNISRQIHFAQNYQTDSWENWKLRLEKNPLIQEELWEHLYEAAKGLKQSKLVPSLAETSTSSWADAILAIGALQVYQATDITQTNRKREAAQELALLDRLLAKAFKRKNYPQVARIINELLLKNSAAADSIIQYLMDYIDAGIRSYLWDALIDSTARTQTRRRFLIIVKQKFQKDYQPTGIVSAWIWRYTNPRYRDLTEAIIELDRALMWG